jgi:hypothetical protein
MARTYSVFASSGMPLQRLQCSPCTLKETAQQEIRRVVRKRFVLLGFQALAWPLNATASAILAVSSFDNSSGCFTITALLPPTS